MSPLVDWLVEHEPSFRKSRLPSLYSDLTVQKTSNPEGYAANVTAWEAALIRASLAGQLPVEQRLILQTSDALLDALASPQYGRPFGLGCVLDECVRRGKMIDLSDFLTSDKSIYDRAWFPSPWAILRWSLRQIGVMESGCYNVDGRLKRGNLVLVPALEEVWKQLQQRRETRSPSLPERITSRELFLQEINNLRLGPFSAQDIPILLRFLSRDKQVLSYDDTTIKFKSPTSSTPEPVTPEDRTIASLKTLVSNLTAQTTTLSSRITTLQATAQMAVKAGNKTAALAALRSKKLTERTFQSRMDTLHQLEEVYAKIETAVDQVEEVAAMEASAGVLKTLNTKVGGVERVEDVIDTLRTEMGKVDDVGGVLTEPLDAKVALDDNEVDEEFEAMEREERLKKEAHEAEVTRRRIAELEKVKAQADTDHGQAQQKSLDEELSTSIEKLQRLDIKGQQPERERDRIAEGTA
ncbi:uncharacterized protein Z518_03407 [Rhinocladiella mackenziei CBS 650.93]|uniref:SNF7 family protein n=1 Tax=Rhinocladiella mackenziei CBS 650.93 TaxID=1442369 RepID=A0A0D2JHB8_9EURO|nr:uncharacterized protein Z518_03407 [Rhinocladiella mackenziei CBS 650.93]KIX08750.1 hypothetical protein Z518_03407 [Rhinocladiella mackenziei CBS 650.93]